MRYVYFIWLVIVLVACKSQEKLADEQEMARRKEITLLEKTRKAHPCDTFRIRSVDSVYQLLPGDTVIRNNVAYVHDTAIIKRTVTKYVVDSAWIKQYQDSLMSERYVTDIVRKDAKDQAKRANEAELKLEVSKEELSTYKRIVFIGGAVLAFLTGGFAILKFKNII
jgi:hypothetical protein